MHPQLAILRDELAGCSARLDRLMAGLSAEDWRRRPAPGGWSVGEHLVHLNLATLGFFPGLVHGLGRAREAGLRAGERYRMDPFGAFLLWVMEPPYRLRVRTKPPFEPQALPPPEEAVTEFKRLQADLDALVAAADGLGIDRVRFVSPFDARFRYNLFAAFRLQPSHQRRHFWTCERLLGRT